MQAAEKYEYCYSVFIENTTQVSTYGLEFRMSLELWEARIFSFYCLYY